VADFWPVPPYSTSLLSLVVGATGKVYAIVPPKLLKDVPEADGKVREMLAPYANVVRLDQAFDRFASPEPLDVVWMGKTYHDFPNVTEMGPLDIAALNKAVFEALRPGGVLIFIDHAAKAGSGFTDTEADDKKRLHRIDPEVVKRQVLAAGFEFVAESPLLANPADDHTKSPFDPAWRNRTDRFVLKFRKPAR
jgi:predicted methyltransferase